MTRRKSIVDFCRINRSSEFSPELAGLFFIVGIPLTPERNLRGLPRGMQLRSGGDRIFPCARRFPGLRPLAQTPNGERQAHFPGVGFSGGIGDGKADGETKGEGMMEREEGGACSAQASGK